jgi:hypothetical protein
VARIRAQVPKPPEPPYSQLSPARVVGLPRRFPLPRDLTRTLNFGKLKQVTVYGHDGRSMITRRCKAINAPARIRAAPALEVALRSRGFIRPVRAATLPSGDLAVG